MWYSYIWGFGFYSLFRVVVVIAAKVTWVSEDPTDWWVSVHVFVSSLHSFITAFEIISNIVNISLSGWSI